MTVSRWFRSIYPATASQNKSIDEAAFHAHVVNVLLVVVTIGIVVVSCTCLSLVLEMRSIRRDQEQAAAAFQNGVFSRFDSLLWKTDTLLTIASAANKSLAAGLTQVRVQVKESSDVQKRSTAAMSQATTSVVKESLATTNDMVQAVVAKATPIVEIKAEKPTIVAAPPAEVKVVPPPTPAPVAPAPDEPRAEPTKRGYFNWLKRLWPFGVVKVEHGLITIYVSLLNEGTDCWRPVKAESLAEGLFRITDSQPEGEQWEFQPGQVVLCRERVFQDGEGLVAFESIQT